MVFTQAQLLVMSSHVGDIPDIFLERISNEIVMLKIGTIHGMLWLQTHFHDDDWDALQLDDVGLSVKDAVRLSQDAEQSGLHVLFP